ncbi:MAG: hypothetical protein EKK53_22535 [Burkholderiales bacterium]|nr:MAG: hypothetical protein EKK53_22535 [Burkholderiales bacterium]
MPIEPTRPSRCRLPLALLAGALASAAQAQTDDTTPFYAGASLGYTHVSNVYRVNAGNALPTGTTNSDNVTSAGLLAGVDKRFGRQHLTVDGNLQNNRYADNATLNNRSYSLRSAFNWETVGDLSGTFSAQTSRALAQFNLGNGAEQVTEKNTERNREYNGLVRLGLTSRYSLEAGYIHRAREFSAPQYDRFSFAQNSTSLGAFVKPGGNLRFGLAARRTNGDYPRYPIYIGPFRVGSLRVDFNRDDVDLTAGWDTGGTGQMSARISTSRVRYQPDNSPLRDFNGTTGALNWSWQATGKINLGLQLARDTGQETLINTTDVNRISTGLQLNAGYALTGKLTLNGNGSTSRSHRDDGSFDNERSYGLGLRWAYSRSLSLACQYNHASRDSSVIQYTYSASSYGCTGQALLY